jgi:carbamoyl-phosphate synthase large subunit
MVHKIGEGKPDIIDLIKTNSINLIINLPAGRKSLTDSKPIRSAAVSQGIPYITTLEGAQAAIGGMNSLERSGFTVKAIQDYVRTASTKEQDHGAVLNGKRTLWGS